MGFRKTKLLLSCIFGGSAMVLLSQPTYANEEDLITTLIESNPSDPILVEMNESIIKDAEDIPLEQIEEKEISPEQKFHNTEEYFYVTEDTILFQSEDGEVLSDAKVQKGDYIKCVAKDVVDGSLFAVEIGKQKGFIDAEKLSREIIFKDENDKIFFKKQTAVYELPDENSAILCVAYPYDTIQIIGRSDNWIRVQFSDNTIAYIKDDGSVDYTSNYKEKTVIRVYQRNLKYNKSLLTGTSYDNKKIIQNSTIGQALVDYAVQFVGNPYVYGGTSLTHGTDCSGFTQGVYKHFGIYINRTSYDQAKNGRSVRLEDARPGDLIIYNGHVGMYMAPGKMVHASTPRTGIMIGPIHYGSRVIDVRRIVE